MCVGGGGFVLVSECFHLRKKKVILVYHVWGIIKMSTEKWGKAIKIMQSHGQCKDNWALVKLRH